MKDIDKVIMMDKEKKLVMSRVPPQTKELFVGIAETEFVGDYGLTLKAILDGYFMWKCYFENMDMKLDKLLENKSRDEEESDDEVKLMSGRIVKKGGKK